MFTGIVEATGHIGETSGSRLIVETPFNDLSVGESIAVNGVCLTVAGLEGASFIADLSEETIGRTTLARLAPSVRVNLERAMKADGRFGGHIVQGHVDGVGSLIEIVEREASTEMWFEIPNDLRRFVIVKGSIAIDGVSLTISAETAGRFCVAVIPHTLAATNLGALQAGDKVNIETDLIARYVERMSNSV
ncbi:MAG: riboflavin synthase [Actinomycetota bacterium]|nr:riboflavin synthase [Actinomycetota bacterium]